MKSIKNLIRIGFVFLPLYVYALSEVALVKDLVSEIKKMEVPAKGKKLDAKQKNKNKKIKNKVLSNFDIGAMSKSALGQYYKKQSKKSLEEFTELFKELMLQSLSKAGSKESNKSSPKNMNVKVLPKTTKDEDKTVVKTLLYRKGEEATELAYAFRQNKIVDVLIDEESVVENFQEQFSEIITESDFSGLIKLMKDKLGKEANKKGK